MFAFERNVLLSLLAGSISLVGMTAAIAQSESGAIDLSVEAACNVIEPGTWTANFQWRRDKRHQGVELDITQYYRGFETERFETIAKLESAESRFEWSGGDPGAEYSWRVRAMIGGRWLVSETARYEVPVCPVDMVRPDDNQVPGKDPASGR